MTHDPLITGWGHTPFGKLDAVDLEQLIRDAALPVVILAAYFLGGLALYMVRVARRGAYHDDEIATRGQSVVIGMAPRHFFAWVMRPLWVGLVRLDFPPDAITILSVLIASATR
jgi:hypothetical protein